MRYANTQPLWIACAILVSVSSPASANSAPEVTNVTAQQRPGTQQVDIYYDLYDADGDLMVVTATCLDGDGTPWAVSSTQAGSAIGAGVTSGQGKHIIWDAGIDMPGHAGDAYTVRVRACDDFTPLGMITVPAGSFIMGDGVAYCGVDEREVTLTHDFYLGQHEVTNQEYVEALQWALDHDPPLVTVTTASVRDDLDGSVVELLELNDAACEISFSGSMFTVDVGKEDHPVIEVTWYGAARYCDWLSLASGLDRAYDHTGDWLCNNHDPYGAEGYRLPTDAEWEYAAQYEDDRIYPWGDGPPNCGLANYSGCEGWTLPVGSCSPAGDSYLGFWDLAGNVWEWCNDWSVCDLGGGAEENPIGEESGTYRVVHGGSWINIDGNLRCASRYASYPFSSFICGFRVARTADL